MTRHSYIDAAELRRRAEAQLQAQGLRKDELPGAVDAQKLLHELQIQQIELEMQNEELRQSRAEVEASLERFADFFDFSPASYFTLQRNGLIQEVNLTGASLLGLERAGVIGRILRHFVAAESLPVFDSFLKNVFVDRARAVCELELLATDKPNPYVHIEAIADASGTICRMSMLDITERMQIETALREKELQYRVAFETAVDGYWMVDNRGWLVEVNDAYVRLSGYSREELLCMNISDLEAQENPQETAAHIEKVMHDGYAQFESKHKRKDGSIWPVHISTTYSTLSGGRLYAFVRDFSERKHAEESLRLLGQITANAAEGIALIKISDNTIHYANQKFEMLFGYSPGELLGKHISLLNARAERSPREVADEITRALEEQGEWRGEVFSCKKDGTSFWTYAHCAVFQHPELGALCISYQSDITESKHQQQELLRAKEEAETASRAASEFLANMSHEIRTPMNSILGMSQLALDVAQSPLVINYLKKIRISGEHLLGIIDDILDFSQIEAGKLNIEISDFNIVVFKNKIASLIGEAATGKGLKLSFDLDPAISLKLSGDLLRLTQILLNYINNAIKFTERGEIIVRAAVVEKSKDSYLLRFEVEDTGIGISAENMGKLFQPFQQADSTTTREYGGSGLGLAISKRLAELMGGEVGGYSTLGKGSTFWFTARLGKGKAKAKGKDELSCVSETDAAAALRGAHILLVEDDLFNQEVASGFLMRADAQVSIANNGKEALELLHQGCFDCVLLDIQMPVMDGLEVIRLIRSNPEWAGLRVIAMTANASSRDRERFLGAGMDDFISKPFKHDMLYSTIAKCLSGRAAQKAFIFSPTVVDAAVTPPQGEGAIIDFASVADFVGNEPREMHAFVSRVLKSLREDVRKIEASLQRHDMAEVCAIAHRMFTPATMIGAGEFADICKVLELSKNVERAQRFAKQLSQLLQNMEAEVKETPE